MDKILIFTNYSSWQRIFNTEEMRNEFGWNSLFNDGFGNTYKILKCSDEAGPSNLEIRNDFLEGEIFLVHDQILLEQLKPLLSEALSEKDLFFALVHTEGNYKDYLKAAQNCHLKEGNHIADNIHCYLPAFNILKDNRGNKKDRMISQIFRPILDTVLCFLQGCLIPNNTTAEFNQAWDELNSIPQLAPLLSEFEKKFNQASQLEAYMGELATLRDKLLEYALQKS